MKQAVIVDLDGTLLNSRKEVSPANRHALQACRESGLLVIVATARPRRTVVRRLPPEFRDDYLVLCNGAWVVRRETVMFRDEIPAQLTRNIASTLAAHGMAPAIEADDCFYTDAERDPNFLDTYHPLSAYPGVDACKVLSFRRDGIAVDQLTRLLGTSVSWVLTDNDTLLQISSATCSKLNACRRVLDAEQVSLKDCFAFGDDHNDLPIVEAVGCGIAMANAVAPLRACATHVTASNDDDGVAKAIAAYVFGGGLEPPAKRPKSQQCACGAGILY